MGLPLAAIVAQNTYLRDASQLQSLSFAVHIPLVCFGIALPALIAYFEWRFLRTGEELYRTIARRWTRIMAALFAIGVITGTILSFEMGMLWPNFMSTFGSVFGLGFAIEGFSFFLEAIFIGIYVYGWNRLSQRLHFLCVLPIVLAGLHRIADGDRGQRLDAASRPASACAAATPSTCTRWRRCSATASCGTS